jgi:hypothetical protein
MYRRSVILGAPAFVATAAGRTNSPCVLVELFTSQGCSSCPPADALLSELAQRADIVALAWHIDYWNHLGWRDPFARSAWTVRQRRYASILRDEVYTPALVINGRQMVVGSDRQAVETAIASARAFSVPVEIGLSSTGLIARVGNRPAASTVSLIVYDTVETTRVLAGENIGRTLRDSRIVTAVTELSPGITRDWVSLPQIAHDQGAVLVVQDSDSAVLAAAEINQANGARI